MTSAKIENETPHYQCSYKMQLYKYWNTQLITKITELHTAYSGLLACACMTHIIIGLSLYKEVLAVD